MNKMRLLLMVSTVTVCSAVVSLPARSGPPQSATGIWRYTPYILGSEEISCNTFLSTYEVAVWSGTITGSSTEHGKVVIHCTGMWSFNAIVNLVATVEDESGVWHSGSMVLGVNASRPDGLADWEGQWVILSGEGELASLRGQGTIWGPGAPEPGVPGDVYYDGKLHFEP